MRLFVGLLLVYGCRAGGADAGDASLVDAAADGDGSVADGTEDGSVADSSVDATASGCALLAHNCPAGTNCYPFPFNEMATGETGCASFHPSGAASPQCASHLECPGGSICSTLFSLGTDCRPLCDVAGVACPQGMECVPLAGYAREGICL